MRWGALRRGIIVEDPSTAQKRRRITGERDGGDKENLFQLSSPMVAGVVKLSLV